MSFFQIAIAGILRFTTRTKGGLLRFSGALARKLVLLRKALSGTGFSLAASLSRKLVMLRKALSGIGFSLQGALSLSKKIFKRALSGQGFSLSGSLSRKGRNLKTLAGQGFSFAASLLARTGISLSGSGFSLVASLARKFRRASSLSGSGFSFSGVLTSVSGLVNSGASRFTGRLGAIIDDIVLSWGSYSQSLAGWLRSTGELTRKIHVSKILSPIFTLTSSLNRKIHISKSLSGPLRFSGVLTAFWVIVHHYQSVSGSLRKTGRLGILIDDIVLYWEAFTEIFSGSLRATGRLTKKLWLHKYPSGVLRTKGALYRQTQKHQVIYSNLFMSGIISTALYLLDKTVLGTLRITSSLARKFRTVEGVAGKALFSGVVRLSGLRFRGAGNIRMAGDVSILREIMYYGVANP